MACADRVVGGHLRPGPQRFRGVAAREQHRNFGAKRTAAGGRFEPAQPGHHDVEEEQVELSRVGGEPIDGLLSVDHGNHTCAHEAKHLFGDPADRIVVFREQNRGHDWLRSVRGRLGGRRDRRHRPAGLAGEQDQKLGALARLAAACDVPAVLPDDTVDHCQPEAGTAVERLGREERLEDPLEHSRAHAVPRI